jgi:hypothetical protein
MPDRDAQPFSSQAKARTTHSLPPTPRRECPVQPVPVGRHQDEMHMVGHQAPRPNLDIGRPAMLSEEIAVERIIGIGEERARAAIAALGDVVRMTGNDDTGEAGHAIGWPRTGRMSIKCTVTVIHAQTSTSAARQCRPRRSR